MSPIIDLPIEFASQSPSIQGEIEIGIGGGYVSIIIIVAVGIFLFVTIYIGRRWSCKDMENEDRNNNNGGRNDYMYEHDDDDDSEGKNKIDIDEVVIQLDQFIEEGRKNVRHRDGNDSSEITMEGLKRNDYEVNNDDDEEKGKEGEKRQESGNTWYSTMVSSLSTMFVNKTSSDSENEDEH